MNQTILITGVQGGIGSALAAELSERGYTIIGTARNPQPAQFPVLPLDLADDQSIASLAAQIRQPIDIVINNAGLATITPDAGRGEAELENLSRNEFAQILNINAIGTFMLTRALLPNLRKGRRKLIVNVSSGLGSIASNTTGGRYAYRASKAALNMITKTFAADLATEDFTVIAWSPGWVKTKMGGADAELTPEESARSLCDLLPKMDPGRSGAFLDRSGGVLDW